MIEIICEYPTQLVMGFASLIGALGYAGYSMYQKKKADPNWKFEAVRLIDTTWQSIAAGAVAGLAIGCGWYGIFTAMITGVGIDKITNKLKIKDKQIFNILKTISDLISK